MTFPRPGDISAALGVPALAESTVFEAFYRTIRALDDLPRPHPPDVGVWWWRRWLAEIGVPQDTLEEGLHLVTEGNLEWVHRRPGVLQTLRALRERGYRLAVISNAHGNVSGELESIGAAPYLEQVIDSHLVGAEKPDPRIFEIAMRRMGVSPERAVHVGDVWSIDVLGARGAGITGIHLDPLGLYDDDGPRIRELAELLEILAP